MRSSGGRGRERFLPGFVERSWSARSSRCSCCTSSFATARASSGASARLFPLAPAETEHVVANVGATIHAIVYGTLLVAAVQGTLGGLAFWALALPAPLFGARLWRFSPSSPVLGAAVVWLPAALYLATTGDWGKRSAGCAGAVVISLVDNLLYPILVRHELRLHTVPVLLPYWVAWRCSARPASCWSAVPVIRIALVDICAGAWRMAKSSPRSIGRSRFALRARASVSPERAQVRGDVARVALVHAEVRHRASRMHRARIAQPAHHLSASVLGTTPAIYARRPIARKRRTDRRLAPTTPGIVWHVAHAYWWRPLCRALRRAASPTCAGALRGDVARRRYRRRAGLARRAPAGTATTDQMSSSDRRYAHAGIPVARMPYLTTQNISSGGHSRAV